MAKRGASHENETAHLVPVAKQAVAILRDIEPLTGRGRYVFPSSRSAQRPLSDNAITAALRGIGYTGEQMSWHGFRAMASTLLNELRFPPDILELQLAHQQRNEVHAAYNRAQRLDERRKMMQGWADYLDGLRAGTNVVPFKASCLAQLTAASSHEQHFWRHTQNTP